LDGRVVAARGGGPGAGPPRGVVTRRSKAVGGAFTANCFFNQTHLFTGYPVCRVGAFVPRMGGFSALCLEEWLVGLTSLLDAARPLVIISHEEEVHDAEPGAR